MQNTNEAMDEINNRVIGINDVFGELVTAVHDGSDYAHSIHRQAGDTVSKFKVE